MTEAPEPYYGIRSTLDRIEARLIKQDATLAVVIDCLPHFYRNSIRKALNAQGRDSDVRDEPPAVRRGPALTKLIGSPKP